MIHLQNRKRVLLKIGICFFALLFLIFNILSDRVLVMGSSGWIYLLIAAICMIAVWILGAVLKQSYAKEEKTSAEEADSIKQTIDDDSVEGDVSAS